ncbi:MAG: M13 family metallopeptidase [Mycobacteriaceae bacterium]|nr:M13 family metallopeptidase [Mycobacteriaceae bacterium]
MIAIVATGCGGADQPPKPQFGTWGIDTADMDRSVRPGDDFFDYALGSWLKTAQIPDDKACVGVDGDLENVVDDDLKSIAEQAGNDASPDRSPHQIGDLYASYMDEEYLDEQGAEPVKPYLAAIDGVTDRADLADVLVRFNGQLSVPDPFPVSVQIDPNEPTRYVPQTWQGGLSLDDREYYLKQDAESVELRTAFVQHVERLLALAGYKDGARQAQLVLALQTKLAEVQWPFEDTMDPDKTSTIMTRQDVEKLGAGAPLQAIFDALKLPAQTDFQVGMPDVLAKTAALFGNEPVDAWKAYLRYQLLSEYANFLSKPFGDELFSFYGRVLSGKQTRAPLWERAIVYMTDAMGDALGQPYVAEHFTETTKGQALKMVEDFRTAYAARIDGAAWMSGQTKAEAQAKLSAMLPKIGYPDRWKSYDDVNIRRDGLLANVISLGKWSWNDGRSKLGRPIDRSEWTTPVQVINAFYNFQLNDITFTAAILQPPFFDPTADPAANYGGIGAVIGHEMSHAFDSRGRKLDSTGALRDWWTAADADRYQRSADELVAQFDSYEPLPGMHINGKATLGENIADLAGLEIAYQAYHLSLGDKDAPVIDGLTGDQRFFIAYAASWKELCRDEAERDYLLTDEHSPARYRVNGIVRNMDEWYTAFGVKEGDALYLKPEDRVRVW